MEITKKHEKYLTIKEKLEELYIIKKTILKKWGEQDDPEKEKYFEGKHSGIRLAISILEQIME